MIGTTAGHYEILEKLGEGGMGVVYKARDVLLHRMAALKFLPAEGADVEDKRARFIHEAQSASGLNHPNIITIYEVAKSGDRDFIAMELVQGQTLDQVIGRNGLSLERALALAIQIADALATAHAAGIVHRDLKPANVMVTDAGLVKVLDFGLAKLMPAASTGATQTIQAHSTNTAGGMIVGTVAYMSPEQAEGKPVDHRSDVFSFGALLHEMLTGRRPFQSDSVAATLAAILTAEPPSVSAEVPGAPRELSRIVARCLRKRPEKRWQSLADVRIALEELKQDLDSGRLETPAAQSPTSRRAWIPAAALAMVAAAVTGLGVWWATRAPAQAPEIWRLTRLTADDGLSLTPAISRDGRLVAYVSDRAGSDTLDLWVQQIDGGDPVRLSRGLGTCREVDFSPDGSKILVTCGADVPSSMYLVPTLGGLPTRIGSGDWVRFSPDGTMISFATLTQGMAPTTIKIAPIRGGNATELKAGRTLNSPPVWRPDGKGLLFVGYNNSQNTDGNAFDWYYLPTDGGPVTPVGAIEQLRVGDVGPGRNLAVTTDGVLFSHGNAESASVYRLPFDSGFQRVVGGPAPIIVGAGLNFGATASQDGRRIAFAIGNNLSSNIWRAAVDPNTGQVTGSAIRLTNGVDPSVVPSPSRDGKRLAYVGGSRRAPEVRLRDLDTGKDLRLAGAKEWTYLTLSPDGSMVAFSSDQRIGSGIYVVSSAGGVPKQVCSGCGRPVEWLADRTTLLIDHAGPNQREIHLLDVNTGRVTPVLRHAEFQLTMPRMSPDRRTLVFTQVRPGRERRLYAVAFRDALVPEQEWSVVVQGADLERQPVWAPGNNTLYFLSDRDGARCIWAQRIDTATRQPIGSAFAAHHLHQLRNSLNDVDVAGIGLSLASGQMFYAAADLQSNIWLAERRASQATSQ